MNSNAEIHDATVKLFDLLSGPCEQKEKEKNIEEQEHEPERVMGLDQLRNLLVYCGLPGGIATASIYIYIGDRQSERQREQAHSSTVYVTFFGFP